MTHFEVITAALGAIVAMLGALAVALKWIYAQGSAAARNTNALDANTEATRNATDALHQYREATDTAIKELDHRMVKVESALLYLLPRFLKGRRDDGGGDGMEVGL
jgi:hypothetical protein